jgi:chaperonin GroES
MALSIRPIHDRIVIKREPEQTQTAGGIYIPDTAREKNQVGTVIAVGKGKKDDSGKHIALDVKVGDRVLFGKYAGTETPRQTLESDGDELIIMREEDILGVVEGTSSSASTSRKELAGARK